MLFVVSTDLILLQLSNVCIADLSGRGVRVSADEGLVHVDGRLLPVTQTEVQQTRVLGEATSSRHRPGETRPGARARVEEDAFPPVFVWILVQASHNFVMDEFLLHLCPCKVISFDEVHIVSEVTVRVKKAWFLPGCALAAVADIGFPLCMSPCVWVRRTKNCPCDLRPPPPENFQLRYFLTWALADWDKCCPADVCCPRLILYLKVWCFSVTSDPDICHLGFQWIKLDDLLDQERQIRVCMAERAGLLSLVLHQTIDHDPNSTFVAPRTRGVEDLVDETSCSI